jgi:hypothetical protein
MGAWIKGFIVSKIKVSLVADRRTSWRFLVLMIHVSMCDCEALSDDTPIWAQARSICTCLFLVKAFLQQPVFRADDFFSDPNRALK